MKRITSIGFVMPTEDDEYFGIDSNASLSDSDIVIFSPEFAGTFYSDYDIMSYPTELKYEGKKLYNKESSAKILDHAKHWNNELTHFIENGGTLFIVLSKKEDFFVYTGTKDISGTGKSQKVTNIVTPFSNYNFLPFKNIQYFTAIGKTVMPNSPLVDDMFKNFKKYFTFETYLKSESISELIFTTKNKDRILGTKLSYNKGHVLFIPNLDLNKENFYEYDEKDDEDYWNKEGLKVGKVFIRNLIEIDQVLRKNSEKTPKPSWLNDVIYQLASSKNTILLINKNQKEIEKKQKENIELQLILDEKESLKDLLFETGKPLENAVTKALQVLGYKAENYIDGELELDQIIVSPEGHRLIGECEGKDNKDIDVTKFRQLHDSLNADFERAEVTEKAYGLLIGNPQRLIKPKDRTLSFTAKCQAGAKREKIGLLKTEDLFSVVKYVLESDDKNFAKECREAIFKQLGSIIVFPPIPKNK